MGVKLVDVSKSFGNKLVLKNISLEIGSDEFFVFLGPSGCGKTTLLRIIAGLEEPDSGEVIINGRVVNGLSPSERNVAMVFQNYALYPHMTAYDNIALNMKIRGIDKETIDRKVREVAQVLHITDVLQQKPRQLSGGQQQRVALARAMVRNPSVFLLDEPLSNLDAKVRAELRAELKEILGEMRVPKIYVTHDQVEAMTLGDRIGIMRDGELVQVGDSLELLNRPVNMFVAGFLGDPPMNFIALEDIRGFEGVDSYLPKGHDANEKLTLGVRPVHVKLGKNEGADGLSIKLELEFKELVGDFIVLHAKVGSSKVLLRVPLHESPKGEEFYVHINRDHMHWFDEKGWAISHGVWDRGL